MTDYDRRILAGEARWRCPDHSIMRTLREAGVPYWLPFVDDHGRPTAPLGEHGPALRAAVAAGLRHWQDMAAALDDPTRVELDADGTPTVDGFEERRILNALADHEDDARALGTVATP